ncbi:hypothetical protein DUNSADRAFT_1267 [Dunaliella salina]|uniref:Encoded protein n=1 Tax=Dunaliella salina TaxID=3046 RepID=A0ABQ7GX98_DUNSA|nr:hypothetical protein DUNSADRAFT_1267 [Dunaliella salina]|eukprot:KAF5839233.1 hypothetical protein DUNSADRAFT_1267 [Dunaliella salina]
MHRSPGNPFFKGLLFCCAGPCPALICSQPVIAALRSVPVSSSKHTQSWQALPPSSSPGPIHAALFCSPSCNALPLSSRHAPRRPAEGCLSSPCLLSLPFLHPLSPCIKSHGIARARARARCPAPIIKARAMLASTEPVRLLRPQGLPAKLAAVGTTSMAVNVPCGMWREHCEKFSGHWFLAVHASIPFIAMLRKAVIMPKYAILFSIATAIAGQTIGSRMERRRVAPLKPTSFTVSSPTFTPLTLMESPTPAKASAGISSSSSSSIRSTSRERMDKSCCNSAQLAALEYFSTVAHGEDGEGACVGGGTGGLQGQTPLTFTHAAHAAGGLQRASLNGGKCGKARLMVSSRASAGLAAAPPALTIVS